MKVRNVSHHPPDVLSLPRQPAPPASATDRPLLQWLPLPFLSPGVRVCGHLPVAGLESHPFASAGHRVCAHGLSMDWMLAV